MLVKQIVEEDFVNYKKPSMFIGFTQCTFKCEKECGERCCQNGALYNSKTIFVNPKNIVIDRYLSNQITEAVVLGGLEPFDTPQDLQEFVSVFRQYTNDDIVIYTGYTEEELKDNLTFEWLKRFFVNIIVKFGRYIPNKEKVHDDVLGIDLASPNQYGKKIS